MIFLGKETTNTTAVYFLQTIFADQPNSAACGLSPGGQYTGSNMKHIFVITSVEF
jgi:hypothetical protein